MTGRYKAYSDYKESGVDWIPNIPFSWKVTSLRHLISSVRNGSTETQLEKSEELVAISRIETISTGEINMDKTGFVNPKLIPESFKLNVGDLLLSHINSLPMVGNVAQVQKNHLIYHGMNLLRLIPKDSVSSRYLYWQLKSDYSRRAIESIAKPAINQASVSTESLKALQLLCPSIAEQQKIASFLDHETAKIDTLIAKQEKLIELLKEKRQAVISHAVTKGLNPDAPMRDSGVEWLGEVPEHWDVTKFNYVIDFLEGPGILAVDFHDEGIPLLRIQNVKEAVVTDNFKTFLDPLKVKDKWEHFRVNEGDLLISASASTGLISEVDERSVGAVPYTGLIRLKPVSENITKDFIRYIVQSDLFYEQIKLLQTGSTIQHFGPIHLQQMKVLLPPIYEQDKVCQHIKSVTLHIDHMSDKANKIIDLTKERKTALISAAVTGKIDVRDFVSEQGQPQGV